MQAVTTPRIYYPGTLAAGGTVTLPADAAGHVARVLRLGEGDEIILFNGDGLDHSGRIKTLRRQSVEVLIGSSCVPQRESSLGMVLLQGLCRGSRMDTVIQKATELGVHRVQPVITQRSIVKLTGERATRKLDHWLGVARAACEQSGRTVMPEVDRPAPLPQAVAALSADVSTRVLLDPTGGETLDEALGAAGGCAVLVGPEGGLTDTERRLAKDAGFRSVRLGPRVLRTETAPIVAISILQYLRGDLGNSTGGD